MSINQIIREYGPKTGLAVARVCGAEEIACNRLFDRIAPASEAEIERAAFERDNVGERFQED